MNNSRVKAPAATRMKMRMPMARSTVPIIPQILPALAVPRFSGGRLPASIAASSLFPMFQANGASTPQMTMPRMPRTRIVVAWLCSGYPEPESDGNWGGC